MLVPLSLAVLAAHSVQETLPYIGSLLATLFSIYLFTFPHRLNWRKRASAIWGLSVLFTPVTALWIVLLSLQRNTDYWAAFSAFWAFPALFFMALAYLCLSGTLEKIMTSELSVDKALGFAWRQWTRRWREFFGWGIFLGVLWFAGLTLTGWSFILLAPVSVALLRATSKSIVQA